jgi:hypothetical protein
LRLSEAGSGEEDGDKCFHEMNGLRQSD